MVFTPTTRAGKPWFLATHGAQARIRIQRAQLQQNRDTGKHAEHSSMHAHGGSERQPMQSPAQCARSHQSRPTGEGERGQAGTGAARSTVHTAYLLYHRAALDHFMIR